MSAKIYMKLRLTNQRFLFCTMLGRHNCLWGKNPWYFPSPLGSMLLCWGLRDSLQTLSMIETFIYLNPLYYFLLLCSGLPSPRARAQLPSTMSTPGSTWHVKSLPLASTGCYYGLLPVEPYIIHIYNNMMGST
jgi:hypothetical protein